MTVTAASEADLKRIYERVNGEGTYGKDWAAGTSWAKAESVGREPRLWPLSAAEFLELEFPKQEPLVEGLVPSIGLGVILGAEKTGKSLLALQIAVSVAAGVPFLDRATRQAPVLLIEEEGAPEGFQRRLKLHIEALGVDRKTLPAYFFVRKRIRLDDPSVLDDLGDVISRLNVGLVIAGPLSQVARIEDENKSGEVNSLTQSLNSISTEHKVMIALIHHRRKASAGQGRPKGVTQFMETSRGSNALSAAVDAGLGLYRNQGETEAWMYVQQRDGESFVQPVAWDPRTLTFSPREEEPQKPGATLEAVLDLLQSRDIVTPSVAATVLGVARNTAQSRLDQLVELGRATVVQGPRKRLEYSVVSGVENAEAA